MTAVTVGEAFLYAGGLIVAGLISQWMLSIYRSADKAAKGAEQAAAAMALMAKELGTVLERTSAHAARLDELGRDLKSVRDYTYERARDQQSVAALVASLAAAARKDSKDG